MYVMYVCMYVCMYACMHVCMYACMYACMHVCMYACMHVCMYACMHVCMYVCMYACMHVCMYACMYICQYLYIYTIYINNYSYFWLKGHRKQRFLSTTAAAFFPQYSAVSSVFPSGRPVSLIQIGGIHWGSSNQSHTDSIKNPNMKVC